MFSGLAFIIGYPVGPIEDGEDLGLEHAALAQRSDQGSHQMVP